MNGLQIYILGCLIAYPISFDFLKMYLRASTNKNLVDIFQTKLEEEIKTKNKNFFKNYLITIIVILSWVMVLVWSYFKIKLLYYFICNNLFRK